MTQVNFVAPAPGIAGYSFHHVDRAVPQPPLGQTSRGAFPRLRPAVMFFRAPGCGSAALARHVLPAMPVSRGRPIFKRRGDVRVPCFNRNWEVKKWRWVRRLSPGRWWGLSAVFAWITICCCWIVQCCLVKNNPKNPCTKWSYVPKSTAIMVGFSIWPLCLPIESSLCWVLDELFLNKWFGT